MCQPELVEGCLARCFDRIGGPKAQHGIEYFKIRIT